MYNSAMAIDTAHDATEVLDAVRRAADEKDWPLAYGMLLELHESNLVVDAEWTEVRYLLGEACWALNDPGTARSYYEQAAVGRGDHAAPATARLEELDRLVEAEAATEDGVSAEEQMGVIAAADEAKGRGDFDTAIALYRRAYDLHTDDAMVTGWLAVDLGECHVALQRYDEAKEWFDWASTIGDDSAKAKAQAGIDKLTALDTAKDMASDGTQASEIPAVYGAAVDAYARRHRQRHRAVVLAAPEPGAHAAGARGGAVQPRPGPHQAARLRHGPGVLRRGRRHRRPDGPGRCGRAPGHAGTSRRRPAYSRPASC